MFSTALIVFGVFIKDSNASITSMLVTQGPETLAIREGPGYHTKKERKKKAT